MTKNTTIRTNKPSPMTKNTTIRTNKPSPMMKNTTIRTNKPSLMTKITTIQRKALLTFFLVSILGSLTYLKKTCFIESLKEKLWSK